MRPLTGVLFAWWPIGGALLVAGVLVGRGRRGALQRLAAAIGLAWIAYVALGLLLLVAWMVFVGISGP